MWNTEQLHLILYEHPSLIPVKSVIVIFYKTQQLQTDAKTTMKSCKTPKLLQNKKRKKAQNNYSKTQNYYTKMEQESGVFICLYTRALN